MAFMTRLFSLSVAAMTSVSIATAAEKNAEKQNGTWEELQSMIYEEGTVISDGDDLITLDTPYRAYDAAIVPVDITIDPPDGLTVDNFTILVEENPAPVAATFFMGDAMGETIRFSTRVRVDAYTNVRVVAQLSDESFWEVANFVKASGGCSAPSLKDAEAALANVGKMKVRLFDDILADAGSTTTALPNSGMREAQVMVRHPNYSGFQMNQVTRLFIPAYFIDDLEVSQNGEMVFRMEGGISISEDPAIRFHFRPNGPGDLNVRAHDTEGDEYIRAFPIDVAS